MSYSGVGDAASTGLPSGQLVIPLPGGGSYTIGGSQATATTSTPAQPVEPPEATMKWTQLVATLVGLLVGVGTLAVMFKSKRES